MNNQKTKRLTKDKIKTKNSYQNKLSPAEIKQKLEEYKRVEDISSLSLNSHLRYFTIDSKTGEKNFRLGGFLTKVNQEKGYIVLSNGNVSWSVQLKNSILFKKMTFQELKDEMREDIVNEVGKLYSSEIKKLKHENKKLKDTLKEIKTQAKKSKKSSKKRSK